MRKTFLFILALCATMMAWGEDVTISKSIKEIAAEWAWPEGGTEGVQIPSFRLGQATVTVTGNNGYYYSSETSWKWHCYMAREKGEFTITVPSVCKLKSVTFSFTGKNSGDAVNYNGTNYASGASIAIVGLQTASFTVGNTKGTTGGQVRLSSISLTYEVEKGVTEDFNKVPTFGTSDTKASGVLDWNVHRVRHSSDKMSDGTSIGCCTWGDNDATAHNSYMETQKGFEGGIKYVEVLWKQMGSEKNNTMKLVAYSDDANPKTIFEQAIGNTGLSGDHITGVEIEAKSNAVLKIQNESFVTATPATGANGRFTIGSITIVPYLRYTYTETQQVYDDESTFDCSLQIDNTDGEGSIAYSSSNTDVVSFADPANTEATIVGGGEATITATWSEGASTSFKLKVNVLPTPVVTFSGITDGKKSVALDGESFTEAATVDMTVPIVYSSSNENVATVDNNGKVTVLTTGTTEITAKVEAKKGEYKEASATYTLTVTASEASELSFVEKFSGVSRCNTAKDDCGYITEAENFIGTDGLFHWTVNSVRLRKGDVIGKGGLRFSTSLEKGSYHLLPDPNYNDGIMEGGIKRIAFTYKKAGGGTGANLEISAGEVSRYVKSNSETETQFAANFFVKENTSLKMFNTKGASVVTIGPISIVPYLLFTTKSDEAFLSLVDKYDIKDVLINNTDDGEVVYSILTEGAKSWISNDGVVTFTDVTKSETITIQAAWTPDGESSATVITTMTLYVDVESKTDKTVDEKFSKYDTEGWTNSEGSEVTKNGDVYDWRVQLTRHKTTDKLVDDQQAIWFAQDGYVATADAEDNTKIGPAEGGIKRIAFDWKQNGANQTGDDLYISVSVDNEEVSAIRRDGGEQPEQPWQYIHNLNVKKNATLKIENKSTTSEKEGGRVKIGTIVITPYLLYTTKEVSKMISEVNYINADLVNNIDKNLDGGTLTFTSSDETVATIATGDETHKDKVVFVAAGDVTISANWTPDGAGEPAITTSYLLHITEKADRGLYFQEAVKETAVGGSAVTNTLNGTLDATKQTWSTASDGVITSVDNVGLVSPVAIGTDTVTVVVAASGTYQEGTASYKVIVRTGVADNNKLVESFSGLSKGTSDTKWEGDLKNYFSWNATSARHNGTAGDTIGGAGVAGTVLFAKGQIATDGVIEGGIKYFTFNWKQPYTEPGATLRLTLNAGDKSYQQDYVVATDNGGTTHEHLYFAGDMQVKKNVQLILKNESFKTDGGAALTENGRIAIDKFEIVPYLFYKTKSYKIDVVKGDASTWTNEDLINNTDGGTIVYSIEDIEGEGVADIDANGQVTAKSNGKAKVTATWTPADALEGEVVTTTYTLEVFAERLDAELAFDPEEITVGVNETTITTPTLINPHELTVKYSSSDETIATVDENSGTITLKGVVGDVTISATSEETDTYKEGSASYTIHVLLLTSEVTFPNLTDNKKTVNMDAAPFTENISVKVNGEEVLEPTITYESSNKNAARVNETTGEVTIISVGTTVITATVAPTETYAGTTASYTLEVEKGDIGDAWVEGFEAIEVKESYVKQEDKVTGDKGVYKWKVAYYQRNTADVIGSDKALRMRGSDAPNNHIMFDGVQEGGIKALAFDWKLAGSAADLTTYFDVTVDGVKNSFEYSGLTGGVVQSYAQAFNVRKNTTLAIEVPTGGQATIFSPISITPYLLYTTKVIEKTYDLEGTNEVDVTENLINNLEVGETVTYSLSAGAQATIDGSTITLANADETITVTATWGEVSTTFTLKVTKAAEGLTLSDTEDNAKVIEENVGPTNKVTILRGFTANTYNTLCLPFDITKDKLAAALNRTITSLAQYSSEATLDAATKNLNITIEETEEIEAGIPCLLQFSGENISATDGITFEGVEIVNTTGIAVGEGTQFIGGINPTDISANDKSVLFVVAGNKLAWNATGKDSSIKGFRAYFNVPGMTPASGVAPRLVMRAPHTPTGWNALKVNENVRKIMLNNQLLIIRSGRVFNAQGQMFK